jgi:hypothetical protein
MSDPEARSRLARILETPPTAPDRQDRRPGPREIVGFPLEPRVNAARS